MCRICHLVSNVQLLNTRPSLLKAFEEVDVRSRLLVYQSRFEYETYFFVGKRIDRLHSIGGEWKLARREIILYQNVLLSKNLTVFC